MGSGLLRSLEELLRLGHTLQWTSVLTGSTGLRRAKLYCRYLALSHVALNHLAEMIHFWSNRCECQENVERRKGEPWDS